MVLGNFMLCIYEMIVGKPLFDGSHKVEKIKQCHIDISKNIFNEAQSFLLFMLQKEGEKRLSVNELLKHKFITNNVKDFSYNNNNNNNYKDNQNYNNNNPNYPYQNNHKQNHNHNNYNQNNIQNYNKNNYNK